MSLICARFRAAGIGLFSADGWVMAEPGSGLSQVRSVLSRRHISDAESSGVKNTYGVLLSKVGLVRCRTDGAASCTAWNQRAFGRFTSGRASATGRGTTGMTTSNRYTNKESANDI